MLLSYRPRYLGAPLADPAPQIQGYLVGRTGLPTAMAMSGVGLGVAYAGTILPIPKVSTGLTIGGLLLGGYGLYSIYDYFFGVLSPEETVTTRRLPADQEEEDTRQVLGSILVPARGGDAGRWWETYTIEFRLTNPTAKPLTVQATYAAEEIPRVAGDTRVQTRPYIVELPPNSTEVVRDSAFPASVPLSGKIDVIATLSVMGRQVANTNYLS